MSQLMCCESQLKIRGAERETRMKERTGKIMMDKKDARLHSNFDI